MREEENGEEEYKGQRLINLVQFLPIIAIFIFSKTCNTRNYKYSIFAGRQKFI